MACGVIYVATNTVTGKQYVGLTTVGVTRRWSNHITHSKTPKTYFHKAIAKYGVAAFSIAEYASAVRKDVLAQLEKDVILQLAPAYNQTHGGEVTFGRKYDEVTKEQIRRANTGKKRTLAQREANRLQKLAWFSEHPDQKITVANQLALARASVDESKRIEAVRAASRDRSWSAEAKAKLSASCMGRRYSPESIARGVSKRKRKVVCVQTGIVYACAADAAAPIQARGSSISAACKHGRSVYGFNFKHVE
jgi:group I intron endonuclease